MDAIVIQIIFRSFDWLGVITSPVEPWLTAISVGRCSGGQDNRNSSIILHINASKKSLVLMN